MLIFVGFSSLYAASAERDGANRDVYSAAVGAWRIAQTGAPWLDGLGNEEYDTEYTWLSESPTGHTVVARSPGVIAAGIPAYWISPDADDFSPAPQALTAALLMGLSVTMFYQLLVPRTRRATALAAAAAFGLTTPIWSIAANGIWTHTVTVPGIIGMALSASRERWWLAGLWGGVALWGRLHAVVIVAALGLGVAILRRKPSIAARVAIPSLAMLALASLWSRWHYGTSSPSGPYDASPARVTKGYAGSSLDGLTNQLGLWVSPDRGFLIWTPIVLLLAPAVIRSWRQLPDWAKVLPAAGVVYTLVQGQLNTFTGGDGFYGYRHSLELLACLAPCLVLSAPAMGKWAGRLIGPVLGVQFAVISFGAISEGWFVLYTDAWRDHSFALALRHEPLASVWLTIALIGGTLAGMVWRERGLGADNDRGRADMPDPELPGVVGRST